MLGPNVVRYIIDPDNELDESKKQNASLDKPLLRIKIPDITKIKDECNFLQGFLKKHFVRNI